MNKRRLLNVRCFRFCFVCMVVVVERTQGFVLHDLESKSLRDPLNGQVAKLLKFEFIHDVLSRTLGAARGEPNLFELFRVVTRVNKVN